MKHLLYLVLSLVIIAAIIPAASATYNCSYSPEGQTFTGNAPFTVDAGASTMNEIVDKCIACGYSTTSTAETEFFSYDSNGGALQSRQSMYQWDDWIVTDNATRYVRRQAICINSGGYSIGYLRTSDGTCGASFYDWQYREPRENFECTAGTIPDKIVNFTGNPLTGPAPLQVLFTAVNLTNLTSTSWSFGDGNITATNLAYISHLYSDQGTYTVRMDYYKNQGAADFIQKINYISVGIPNATKTKYYQTIDGTSGNIVTNSSIQLNDIENSSWTNATGLTADGMSYITTLAGHHINAYAQALGYSDGDLLNKLNDGQPEYIMLWPTFAKNVSAGNVSLYVTVKDKDTKANIIDALVRVTLANGNPTQETRTNSAGIAYFVVSNNTVASVSAMAGSQGYASSTTTINTGTGSGGSASAAATILLSKNTVTPTTEVTTIPGQPGVTPTVAPTILPGCEDTVSAEGQAKCRSAQSNQGLSFLAANMGNLIMVCVFVTIMYLLGFRLGK